MRKDFRASVKIAALKRADGKCEGCGLPLTLGKYACDHINPDGLTGEPTLENCRVLCIGCHKEKTKRDVADIAKAKRREAKHTGMKRRSSRPIPGSKGTPFKRRIGGATDWRTT